MKRILILFFIGIITGFNSNAQVNFEKESFHQVKDSVNTHISGYPYDKELEIELSNKFKRMKAPETGRQVVKLTEGEGFHYPLYYFIPSITKDFKYLIYHWANKKGVQLQRLNLKTGESLQITEANVEDSGWYNWDGPNPGTGVLDHRSVLNVELNKVIYFTGKDGREVHMVDVSTLDDKFLFKIPEGREAIGQNCCTPDGKWFVYIHAPRGSRNPKPCKGAVLAAYNFKTKEKRILTTIDFAIHHVQPYGNEDFIFCHTPTGNGMLMTNLNSSPRIHLRDTEPGVKGKVCHHVTTSNGIAFEAYDNENTISGLFIPNTKEIFEFLLPKDWGYSHTGWDPEGKLFFWEISKNHHIEYLKGFDSQKNPIFEKIIGEWPTYGQMQKSHFHPQLTPDRNWLLFVGGDPETQSNQIYMVDVSDLKKSEPIKKEYLKPIN